MSDEAGRRITTVVFDVGETLVDETRAWSLEADRAGVTRLTLFAALGALIHQGRDHRDVWPLLGLDRPAEPYVLEAGDLYPDVRPCLQAAVGAGLRVGVAGNQPEAAEVVLRSMDLPVAFVGSSQRWGVRKPDPRYFQRLVREAGEDPARIAHVGDRVDNDVLPARAAGLWSVFVRRGPWGHLHALRPEAAAADLRVDDLRDLVPALLTVA